jgi:hypothetical protein
VSVHAEEGLGVHTKAMLRNPASSGLHWVGTGGIGRDREFHLVLFDPFGAAFNNDEHTPRFQALDKLSNSLSIVCNLRRIDTSVPIAKDGEYLLL